MPKSSPLPLVPVVEQDMFAKPFNWCDRRCETCPLAPTCTLATLEAARDAAFPDRDPMEWIAEDLAKSLALITKIAAEDGIDLDVPIPEPPEQVRRFESSAKSYAVALLGVVEHAPLHADWRHVTELRSYAMLVAGKCAAIACFVDPEEIDRDVDFFVSYGAPILLMLEVVAGRMRASMLALFEPELLARLDVLNMALDRELRPLYEQIPAEARVEMERRIDAGEAPSPFVGSE